MLNGGLDMCGLIALEGQDPKTYAQFVESVKILIGRPGIGAMDVVMLERDFDQTKISGAAMDEAANKLYLDILSYGSDEIIFTMSSLMIRNKIAEGKFAEAMSDLESFERRVEDSDNILLRKNLKAFRTHVQMYRGDSPVPIEWLQEAPNSMETFSFLERYEFLCKSRVLITIQSYDNALALLNRLLVVFRNYHRPYYEMQTLLLLSIVKFRLENEDWKDDIHEALKIGSTYYLVCPVAEEGAAILPVLNEFAGEGLDAGYMNAVRKRTELMARYYPNYMRKEEKLKEPLTNMERKVIRLMSFELSSSEICDMLSITYNGLKFHKKNIYRKLGVNNQIDAIRMASRQELYRLPDEEETFRVH